MRIGRFTLSKAAKNSRVRARPGFARFAGK